MFMNFRRIRRCKCVQLLTTCLVLCMMVVCWEQLDHHVVCHLKSYSYRYLINSYDFINTSLAVNDRSRNRGGPPHYLINNPNKCAGAAWKGNEEILVLLFVKSSPDNFERRKAIRDTWGNESYAEAKLGENIRVLFALGVHHNPGKRAKVQRGLLQENHYYRDIIQQDFVDTFHNLTAKLLLQFHWGHTYCPRALFLMSADDDIFVHMPNLVHYLQGLLRSQTKDLWVGHVHRGSPPVRRKDSKYHVPYEMYPWPAYPDYTAGAGYVVSGDVVAKIYRATLALNTSMYIDDVFMGICANAAGVSPQDHAYFSGEGKAPYHPCIYEHMITSHGHSDDVRSLWRAATQQGVEEVSSGFMGSVYCTVVRVMLLCRPYQNSYPCLAAFSQQTTLK